ncbi:MAG TPA: ABC transporter permease, partial [Limnochordales bacterium]
MGAADAPRAGADAARFRPPSAWQRLRRRPVALAALVVLAGFVAMALFAPALAPFEPDRFVLSARLAPPWPLPGWRPGHWLGTDELGRDILSRIIYGARLSLAVGTAAVAVSAAVGTALGAVAGYRGGRLDQTLSRAADLLMAFPYLLFAVLVMGLIGPGVANLILALSFKAWVEFFRLARGE